MKSKFYLATAALALTLAACTDEVDLQSQSALNQTSPITFTLDASDGLGSRNYWNGYTLGWDENTHLSLFHQGGNAIYKAAKGSANDKLTFTTQSMVSEGQAIMVHPADTTFEMNGQNLYVKIPQVLENADSILQRIPFISEYITIAPYDGTKNQGAGYGKSYNIKLRQIATQLTMKTEWTGDKKAAFDELVATKNISKGLEIDSVDLYSARGFNVKMPISANDQFDTDSIGLNWEEAYGEESLDQWTAASELDFNGATTANKLTSKVYDREKDQVEFMILPQGYLNEQGVSSRVSKELSDLLDSQYVAENDSSTITIDTYYGRLTIGNMGLQDNDSVVYYGEKDDTLFTVGGAFNFVRYVSTLPENRPQSTFLNEIVGSHVTLKVEADLANLDMSTVHIKNDQQLQDMITVYELLQPNTNVTFTIDGDKDQVFEMSTTSVEMLDRNYKEDSKITLNACTIPGEKCSIIRLKAPKAPAASRNAEGIEVPSMKFMSNPVKQLILDAETSWIWSEDEKEFAYIRNIVNEGTLTVTANNVFIKNTYTIYMYNNGTMNIDGEVKQSENIVNNGIINIGEGDEYYVNAVLTNEATKLDEYGKIYNSGVFGNINNGVINNYGYIQQVTKNSKTFITSNQTDNVSFGTPWSTTNKYGTIELFDKDDDNYSVSNTKNEGFILLTTTAATVTADEIGVEANYVKVAGECTALNFTRTATENTRVLFIEIASNKEVEWTTEGSIIRGLKVPAGKKLYIKKDNKVEISEGTYLKGKIYKGGDFTPKSFVTYFGVNADLADSENVIKWAN